MHKKGGVADIGHPAFFLKHCEKLWLFEHLFVPLYIQSNH